MAVPEMPSCSAERVNRLRLLFEDLEQPYHTGAPAAARPGNVALAAAVAVGVDRKAERAS
jgi:hypothetical protein